MPNKPRLRCEGGRLWLCYAKHPRGFIVETCGILPELAYGRLILALELDDPFFIADLVAEARKHCSRERAELLPK